MDLQSIRTIALCAVALVIMAGMHVTFNTWLLQDINSKVNYVTKASNDGMNQIKNNQVLLENLSKALDLDTKTLNERTPIILGIEKQSIDTDKKMDELERKIEELEKKLK